MVQNLATHGRNDNGAEVAVGLCVWGPTRDQYRDHTVYGTHNDIQTSNAYCESRCECGPEFSAPQYLQYASSVHDSDLSHGLALEASVHQSRRS